MTNEELKEAFFDDADVVYKSKDEYEVVGKIQHILYGKDEHKRLIVSAEIVPYNGNSITIARVKDVERRRI